MESDCSTARVITAGEMPALSGGNLAGCKGSASKKLPSNAAVQRRSSKVFPAADRCGIRPVSVKLRMQAKVG